jgi:hypothetical protein
VITNQTTDEKLDFTGITISAGDYYDIDLRYGRKTAVDSNGDSVLDELTNDSDLATWHIAAAPEAPGGANSIHVSGTAITTATKVDIAWLNRHIGI